MRLSQLFGAPATDKTSNEGNGRTASGLTIDLLTGIVAGLAFVLAVMILATSLKHPQTVPTPGLEQGVTRS
jgi:hypothetical protein